MNIDIAAMQDHSAREGDHATVALCETALVGHDDLERAAALRTLADRMRSREVECPELTALLGAPATWAEPDEGDLVGVVDPLTGDILGAATTREGAIDDALATVRAWGPS